MNIIIVGAGKVGLSVASVLSREHDVLVIENDPHISDRVKAIYNVSVFNENGSNPAVLNESIHRHQAEVVIATTRQDDVNLFICMMAKQFGRSVGMDIITIARVIDPDYSMYNDIRMNGVDHIFSPELLTADILTTIATLENAVDYEDVAENDMGIATFQVTRDNSEIIGKVVIGLDTPPECSVVAIYRGDEVILDNEIMEIHEGDKLCVLGTAKGISDFNAMMGIARQASEFVVLGATVTGLHTARLLESKRRYVKIVEPDTQLCMKIARQYSNMIVVNGSPVDPHLLKMENVGRSDVLFALAQSDESNLLACLMGKKLGAKKIVSSYSFNDYEDIFEFTGIQTAVGYHHVVTNEISKTLAKNNNPLIRLKHEGEFFFGIRVSPHSAVANQRVGDVRLPAGCRIACIVRKAYSDDDQNSHREWQRSRAKEVPHVAEEVPHPINDATESMWKRLIGGMKKKKADAEKPAEEPEVTITTESPKADAAMVVEAESEEEIEVVSATAEESIRDTGTPVQESDAAAADPEAPVAEASAEEPQEVPPAVQGETKKKPQEHEEHGDGIDEPTSVLLNDNEDDSAEGPEDYIFPRLDTVFEPNDKVLLFTYNVKLSKLEKLFRSPVSDGVVDVQ